MKATYTVTQFCDGHNISRTHFYDLLKKGQGPRLMRLGRRCLISAEAAADWRKRMEAETDPTQVAGFADLAQVVR